MKRDMDLIRALLLKLEAIPLQPGGWMIIPPYASSVAVDGYTVPEIDYHLNKLREAGFLSETRSNPAAGIAFCGLSWAGHDFLDSVRDPEIWSKTKNGAAAAGGFTLDLIKELAKGLIKTKIEEHTGVKL